MAAEKWFTKAYRRNLVDMHIEDWDEAFLSRFDPAEYAANLKKAHIQAPMIYLQSHVGHCNWPTKTGHMHGALKGREDLMRRLLAMCKKEGMFVVGYYSLIYNTVEEIRHPEWRVYSGEKKQSGYEKGGRYGHCCPCNGEYVNFVKAQIAEMAEYFVDENGRCLMDGMFYDMTFWPEVCECEHCQARYLKETGRSELPGGKLPSVNWKDPLWLEFQGLREKWMAEFARIITEETRRQIPGVSVEHNYANAVANDTSITATTEMINEWCDYTGGDLYGDEYNHSFTAKYYYNVTKNPPFEYMTCRCDRTLYVHTITKTEAHLSLDVLLTAAHHGASFIIDAIDPVGTLDGRVYDRIGKVFEKQIPYEPYFRGDMVQEVGVHYSTSGRYNTRSLSFNNKTCVLNLTRTLIEENIPMGVVANNLTGEMDRYRMVFAPNISGISDANRTDMVKYVENGGVLYVSGAEDIKLLQMLFGAELTGFTEENAVYMAPTAEGQKYFGEFNRDYPMPTVLSLPVLNVKDVTVLATMTMPYTKPTERRFASIHSNPPGIPTDIPALIEKKLGRGTVIWSAAPIENDGRRAYKNLIMALLEGHIDRNALTVRTTAPRQVELVTFRDGDTTLVSAVDLLCTDELLKVNPFAVEIRCEKPAYVVRLGGQNRADTEIPFTWENGYVRFMVDDLVMFDMYKIN
ncbi:MAG: alpha-L-fucosidase [Clostridia bacterium]|nr:alpha-L-fucosidase [Clostridia bacterium]